MTLSEVGSAADEAVLGAGMPRQRDPFVPQRGNADDLLLDAIRRGLSPADPVALLLARWPAAPATAVDARPRVRGAQRPPAPADPRGPEPARRTGRARHG